MKKIWKKVLGITLALTMLLAAIPVQADDYYAYVPDEKQFTLDPSKSKSQKEYYCNLISKATNLKSTNNSVVSIKQIKNSAGYNLYLYPKKAGKATVSFKYGPKTYKTAVRVYKYVNPISSVTLGKTKLSSSKFKNGPVCNLKYSDFANKKIKVTFKLKSGWKLYKIYDAFYGFEYALNGWMMTDRLENGSTITITDGKGAFIRIVAENKSTGQSEEILIKFK